MLQRRPEGRARIAAGTQKRKTPRGGNNFYQIMQNACLLLLNNLPNTGPSMI